MEDVHLVQRQQIDELEDKLLGHEVATHVKHGPAPTETGRVFDMDARDRPVLFDCRIAEDRSRQQLPQRLAGVEESGRRPRRQFHRRRCDIEQIAFLAQLDQILIQP